MASPYDLKFSNNIYTGLGTGNLGGNYNPQPRSTGEDDDINIFTGKKIGGISQGQPVDGMSGTSSPQAPMGLTERLDRINSELTPEHRGNGINGRLLYEMA